MWLIVRQLHIIAGWWDAPLAFRDFSQNNKHDCSWLVAVKIELIVSQKAGCSTIFYTRLVTLTFPLTAMFINIYNVLMLFERFSREEVATAKLSCESDINIKHRPSVNKSYNLHILFTYLCLKFLSYNWKLVLVITCLGG